MTDNLPFAEGHDADDADELAERQWKVADAKNRGGKWPTKKHEQFISKRLGELKKLPVGEVPGVGAALKDDLINKKIQTVSLFTKL